MTEAIDRIRALLADVTPGPWVFGKYHRDTTIATVCHVSEFSVGPDGGDYGFHGACKDDADYIAACNPAAMAEVLDHIDAQAQDIAEMTTALANCRNAFQPPAVGSDLEALWSCAMSRVDCVDDYVVAAEKSQQQLIRGYVDDKLELEERVADQAQEIDRLKQQLKYQEHRDGHIGTHGEGCFAWGPSHYECALREIERLRAAQMPIPLSNILMAKSKRFPSLRKMAEMLDVDVGYLSRLCSGEKFDPSDEVLMKLGLRRTVSYEEIYKATPLTLPTKSA